MRRSTKWMLFGGAVGAAAGFAAGYGTLLRPWHLRWGATDEEFRRPMPLDELVPDANFYTTRAVTVAASPDEVWPFVTDLRSLPSGTTIRRIEERRWIAFAPPEPAAEASWVVLLEPLGERSTRVISRNRARFARTVPAVIRYLLVDPGQFLVEREWLLGVKLGAEELARSVHGTAVLEGDHEQELAPEQPVGESTPPGS